MGNSRHLTRVQDSRLTTNRNHRSTNTNTTLTFTLDANHTSKRMRGVKLRQSRTRKQLPKTATVPEPHSQTTSFKYSIAKPRYHAGTVKKEMGEWSGIPTLRVLLNNIEISRCAKLLEFQAQLIPFSQQIYYPLLWLTKCNAINDLHYFFA